MLLSGSLAKGTSLKSLSDIDVAAYVSSTAAPSKTNDLISWLAERLREAFPNFKPQQVVANPYTVTVLFLTSGLKVDVVPVFYDGDANWKGHLVSKDTGERILTSIPMHLDFIRRRKDANKVHFAQVVRLLKHWAKLQREQNPQFRFKSFMIELLVAKLADNGLELDDYPEALAQIFAYIATDGFHTDIAFTDYYSSSMCKTSTDPIRIWDPVNHDNNVSQRYTESQRSAIVEGALEAGDAIDSALYATTKADTLRYWRKVFGPTFEV
jgi:tRNA nucleotidyltransferase (CCA-adding enzyme)